MNGNFKAFDGLKHKFERITDLNAASVLKKYEEIVQSMGFLGEGVWSYNVLLTPRLLWVVERSSVGVSSPDDPKARVELNSMGFAGEMFVKN